MICLIARMAYWGVWVIVGLAWLFVAWMEWNA
jgi:hypothetical protein